MLGYISHIGVSTFILFSAFVSGIFGYFHPLSPSHTATTAERTSDDVVPKPPSPTEAMAATPERTPATTTSVERGNPCEINVDGTKVVKSANGAILKVQDGAPFTWITGFPGPTGTVWSYYIDGHQDILSYTSPDGAEKTLYRTATSSAGKSREVINRSNVFLSPTGRFAIAQFPYFEELAYRLFDTSTGRSIKLHPEHLDVDTRMGDGYIDAVIWGPGDAWFLINTGSVWTNPDSDIGAVTNAFYDPEISLYDTASQTCTTIATTRRLDDTNHLLRYGNFRLSDESGVQFDELSVLMNRNATICPAEGAVIKVASYRYNVQLGELRQVSIH